MFISCGCGEPIEVYFDDFGISYCSCPTCGREYEINVSYELAVDIDEDLYDED